MAAAAALSSHSLSSVPRLYASRKPSKTLEFKALTLQSIIQHPRQSRLCSITNVGFQMSKPLLVPRRSVKSFLCTEESEPGTIDGEEEDDQNNQVKPELKTLIKVYKEAVLDGDEKTVSEIEAMICIIENEKNELVEKVAALSADTISGKDKYLRLKADFENFRKRSDKEKLTIIADAQGEVIESLLPMIDNFERAKQQIKTETEKEKSIDTSYQGIYKQFVEIMKSMNVAVVPTVGKPFDPSNFDSQDVSPRVGVKDFLVFSHKRLCAPKSYTYNPFLSVKSSLH
ncbi:PREDICTED: uncharacterized protein LOC104588717 isoform X2 [Nelumbo nucifera]|uniref:Uncharacterized protein LOC104588717 isoform X2 n=1 Tax=Nelumbo nucifera TaxID=4432 RepID=A0A1U7YX28_NELNU|nr:PREDICTED: uncharacterized protein LOC104588717 isoform X2 [Nelumbo nucifera]